MTFVLMSITKNQPKSTINPHCIDMRPDVLIISYYLLYPFAFYFYFLFFRKFNRKIIWTFGLKKNLIIKNLPYYLIEVFKRSNQKGKVK